MTGSSACSDSGCGSSRGGLNALVRGPASAAAEPAAAEAGRPANKDAMSSGMPLNAAGAGCRPHAVAMLSMAGRTAAGPAAAGSERDRGCARNSPASAGMPPAEGADETSAAGEAAEVYCRSTAADAFMICIHTQHRAGHSFR